MRTASWSVGPAATARRAAARGGAVWRAVRAVWRGGVSGPCRGISLAGAASHVISLALLAAGCTAPRRPLVVTDPDPSVKIPAYKKAVRTKDRAADRQLVADLDSDDPAVRLYAIDALRRLTGETFGYHYYESEEQRLPAVVRWHKWLDAGEKVTEPDTRPAPENPGGLP